MDENRKKEIIEFLNEQKYLNYLELSKLLNVSELTIRRNVDVLEAEGYVTKLKSGSIIKSNQRVYKDHKDFLRKKAIGKFASKFIEDGDSLVLDPGTTIKQIISFLSKKNDIIVYTQSVDIIYDLFLLNNNKISVISGGGILDYKLNLLFDERSISLLNNYRFNKGFLSCTGITTVNGATNFDLPPYLLKKTLLDVSDEQYFLIDSSKFGKNCLKTVCPIDKIKTIITDKDIDDNIASDFKKIIPNFYIVDY